MPKKKPYKLTPAQMRKLRDLRKQEADAINLCHSSWQNGDVKEAKAAAVIADQSHAKWLAYFNKLVGWQENGVPQADYAI